MTVTVLYFTGLNSVICLNILKIYDSEKKTFSITSTTNIIEIHKTYNFQQWIKGLGKKILIKFFKSK